jgi:hypothetical protein
MSLGIRCKECSAMSLDRLDPFIATPYTIWCLWLSFGGKLDAIFSCHEQ